MNEAIQKMLVDRPDWRRKVEETKVKLRSGAHFDVLEDLAGFTGLSEDEIAFRVLRKYPDRCAARGWFFEEWEWHDPKTAAEINWFYKCSQSYIFSNARKGFWKPLDEYLRPKKHKAVLDYGSGVGTNVLGLIERGFQEVAFYDVGILQQEFLRFRVQKRKLYPNMAYPVGDVWSGGHMLYDAIVLHDVLEHVPQYEKLLGRLIDLLRVGGVIVERSAFGSTTDTKKPFHLPTKIQIGKAMVGMEFVDGHKDVARCWRKI